jgi:site-specific DNA-methyltransferase (adenine-specific)
MPGAAMTNHLYYGDNLAVLRNHIASGSVDLVYLDPPFNSNLGKKGADRGLDGNLYFGKTSRAIVSVKAGANVSVQMIRDLRGVIERERAGIGVFLTLAPPTRPMVAEAAAAGQFEEPGFAAVPRIQVVTVD